MEERKYLKWYNKVGYGSGDLAANMVYALISSFCMIYLTDAVGLNAGIVGTLIMFSKIADGVSDVFFGNMIDKTNSKMGKARPWMLYSYLGNAIMLIAIFAIPSGMGTNIKYAYFFITYTLLNAIFYTANNIAYSSLTALVTKNTNERVQLGSIRFMFALATTIIVSSITVNLVDSMGGSVVGWRNVAILYAFIGLIVNTIAVFSVREIKDDSDKVNEIENTKVNLWESFKLLASNKYYIMIVLIYVFMYMSSGLTTGAGIYYMTYILHSPSMLGTFTLAGYLPMIIGLIFTPLIIKKMQGMYKANFYGYVLSTVFKIPYVIGGYIGSVPLMLVSIMLSGLAASPLTGDLNALIATVSDYTFLRTGKRIDGTMYSCSSLGIKIGTGIGTALAGWLLAAGKYIPNAETQPASCISMLNVMYLWIPLLISLILTIILRQLKVEQANKLLKNKMNV